MNTSVILAGLRDPRVLKTLQVSSPVGLAFIAGIAACLHSWVIPLIQISGSARNKIAQFQLAISLGFRYLQPGGRILGAILASTTLLLYTHPNVAIARLWKLYGSAAIIALSASPFEEFMIFPTNNRISAIGDTLRKEGKEDFDDEKGGRKQELNELLLSWQRWHVGRIMLPLTAAIVSAVALAQS